MEEKQTVYCSWCEENPAKPAFWPTCSAWCAKLFQRARRDGLR